MRSLTQLQRGVNYQNDRSAELPRGLTDLSQDDDDGADDSG